MSPPASGLSETERLDWLHLARIDGLGPRGVQMLVRRYGEAGRVLQAISRNEAGLGQRYVLPKRSAIEAEFRALAAAGAQMLALPEPDYPALLRQIDAPPPVITVRGRLALAARPAVALVGARNASALGRKMAAQLAAGLSAAGYVVVSGLARGIDAEAHRASLGGGTIAVLAGGLDRPYPPENEALSAEIGERGLLLSEMPINHGPRGQDFPRRNRLIAGLSLGVVVVEAARRSGSLITARMAAEQGRDILAVPGSPLDLRCEGSNDLLREGATLVTRVEDVIEALGPMAGRVEAGRDSAGRQGPGLFRETGPALPPFSHAPRQACQAGPAVLSDGSLVALLPYEGVDIDELGRMAGLPPPVLAERLLDLELSGLAIRLPGNRMARVLT